MTKKIIITTTVCTDPDRLKSYHVSIGNVGTMVYINIFVIYYFAYTINYVLCFENLFHSII